MKMPVKIKLLAFTAFCLLLFGCGSGHTNSSTTGVYVDNTYYNLLEREFHETLECTGLEGRFWDVAVVLLPPPQFACLGDNNKGKMCYGEFARPNKVLLADRGSWKHEVVHYLLYENTGDLDPGHESELFKICS